MATWLLFFRSRRILYWATAQNRPAPVQHAAWFLIRLMITRLLNGNFVLFSLLYWCMNKEPHKAFFSPECKCHSQVRKGERKKRKVFCRKPKSVWGRFRLDGHPWHVFSCLKRLKSYFLVWTRTCATGMGIKMCMREGVSRFSCGGSDSRLYVLLKPHVQVIPSGRLEPRTTSLLVSLCELDFAVG